MKLENVKIIHTILDIPINYNNTETNVENVFILDNNNNNINGITYTCPIYFDSTMIDLSNKKIYNYENVFLFYSFMYQIAFGHFTEQCLPKLNYYLKLKQNIKNIKLCIPKKRNNLIVSDIIKLLNLADDEIVILDFDSIILCKNFYYNNYECSDFNIDKIETFNLIREKLCIKPNILPNRNVYIKRNKDTILESDCHNIGKTRQIVNENILIEKLKLFNFEIITLGEHNLNYKNELLSNVNILITQTGGTMYNLIFSNTPKNIILLSNNYPLHGEYINNLLPKLKFYTPKSLKTFKYKSYIQNCDNKNSMNDPFNVNIDEIMNYCKTL
jgi:capsular polysaccharide biosynthesis protein